MAKDTYFYALGRRKRATARVRLQSGKGNIVINGKPAVEFLCGSEYLAAELKKPFTVIEKDTFDISAIVSGGGFAGQVDAVRLGIAKALAAMNEDLKGTLKRAELLSRDPREKERKKFGFKKARKQRQFTKR
ncbi:30S ribosomal protein S9 [Candidatus Saccharibacteria bacterium]|nr:30S ribosomal protein S9 [Candidatus Saccharibacteria bacterium]